MKRRKRTAHQGLVILDDTPPECVLVVDDDCTDEDLAWLRRHYRGGVARRSDGPPDFDD